MNLKEFLKVNKSKKDEGKLHLFLKLTGNTGKNIFYGAWLTLNIFERIINGSFPEVNSLNGRNREQFYETYIRTYLERDVRELII